MLTFLCTIEQSPVLWSVTNFDNLGASQELHDQTGCDDGRDTQLHEGASV